MDATTPQNPPPSSEATEQPKSSSASSVSTNPPSSDNLAEEDGALVKKDDNGFQYFTCRFCGLTFNYINTLRAHERVHNVEMPFVCGKCGESFHFSCELEYHSQQHSNVSGHKCECGRTFFTYTELLYHRHSDEESMNKLVQKSLEPVTLVQPSTSRVPAAPDYTPAYAQEGFEPKHPLKVYKDVRSNPYICEYCSKSYPDSRQLAYHMYSHRGEKSFNPRSSRYLMGRNGVGYTDPPLFRY